MAEFYLDVSAVGNEYQAYADTPATWAVPQDGNGKAGPGHAAAVAVATIDCNGATASGTGTVGVLGVTVSSTLNASGAALATAIVTAINASATATGAGVCSLLLPLNRLVFARVNPVLNTQVQIMLRIAGIDWNGLTPTRANITGGGVTAFAGGANGPFAYFHNNGAVFGFNYGLYGAIKKSPGITDPGASDSIIIRSARSGAALTSQVEMPIGPFTFGTSSPRNFVVDNGTYWTGDNGQFLVRIFQTAGSNGNLLYLRPDGGPLTFSAIAPEGVRFLFEQLIFNASNGVVIGGAAEISRWHNCLFEAGNANTALYLMAITTSSSSRGHFESCRMILRKPSAISNLTASVNFYMQCIDCKFEWVGIGGNVLAAITHSTFGAAAALSASVIRHKNCSYSVDGGAYAVAAPLSPALIAASRAYISFDGSQGLSSPALGFVAAGAVVGGPEFVWSDPSTFSFRHETFMSTTDWIRGNPYPTLTATTPDGFPMVYRVSWEQDRLPDFTSVEVGRVAAFYRSATAVRTISLELLAPTADIPNTAQVYMSVSYVDSSGAQRVQSSRGPAGALLSPALAVDLPNGVGLGAWSLSGVTGVASKKLTLTTDFPVKVNSEVVATLYIGGAPVGIHSLYFNPELAFA